MVHFCPSHCRRQWIKLYDRSPYPAPSAICTGMALSIYAICDLCTQGACTNSHRLPRGYAWWVIIASNPIYLSTFLCFSPNMIPLKNITQFVIIVIWYDIPNNATCDTFNLITFAINVFVFVYIKCRNSSYDMWYLVSVSPQLQPT